MSSLEQIKKLREETGISLAECQKAIIEAGDDLEKAKEILRGRGREVVKKKSERQVCSGLIESYIHPSRKMGVLLDIRCETDFVASNKDFQSLAHELCLQIAAMNPENKESLLGEPWVKDESRKIKEVIAEKIAKLGENIVVEKFIRFDI